MAVKNKIIHMKKIFIIISFLLFISQQSAFTQEESDTSVYLITCGPGIETYSIYGHTALRVVIPENNSDLIYNWGVFDFSTPNFAWKFAKGRLDYMLAVEPLTRFLNGYFYEKRFVYSQKINLNSSETKVLLTLISENLKPENISYRYDFFYDDCSTRIRDLLEKAIGKSLLYPPAENIKNPTFRDMVGKYQDPFPWLKFGVDLIMGSPGDKEASFRDRMFLPIDMQNQLVDARINRNSKMVPLLQNPEALLDFSPVVLPHKLLNTPIFILTLFLIIVVIISGLIRSKKGNRLIDIFVYSVFSILALLMIFFNFFTDHHQMKWNLNIIWLNPLIIICLVALIINKTSYMLFRTLFVISVAFLILSLVLPQDFNNAITPLVLILIIRSSVRSEFNWNPLSLTQKTSGISAKK